jgi:hypothetical protein
MMDVYLEVGKKRTFAAALDWPGWCRSGKDDVSALQALLDYGPRYALAIADSHLGFIAPGELQTLTVIERLEGNAVTDFGAPVVAPSADQAPLSQAELERFRALLQAMWDSFDATVCAAEDKALRTGPRGGGRDLQKIIDHVYGADQGYLSRLGGALSPEQKKAAARQGFPALRQAVLDTLGPAARGELPREGPRGGKRWGPRFYVRYSAWHLLDHTWEIEDRVI